MKYFVRISVSFLVLNCLLWSSELTDLEKDVRDLYGDVSPSIVSIHYGFQGDSDFIGTGIVVDGKGHIVTIKRFLKDGSIWVETDKGEKLKAELLGSDSETGIAVFKVKEQLKPVRFCDLKRLGPGDFLFIIGNSFGLKNGISISIFSGTREKDEYLQLGNTVLPGNSGAGVFNSKGELAGIVSFILGTSFFYGVPEIKSLIEKELKIRIPAKAGLSTAMNGPGVVIPQQRMMEIAEEIIKYGKIERGWLGVFIRENAGNVVVKDLVENSPALDAGIKEGDIILEYNDKIVSEVREFIKMVKETKPGTKIGITVKRGKKKIKVNIKIGRRPEEEKLFRFKEVLPINPFFEKEKSEKSEEKTKN